MKRLADLLVSLVGLILLTPVIAVLGLLVRVFLGRPVIFRQPRPGKDGKIFDLVKFRTMTNTFNEYGDLLPDAERLTGFGKFLRSTSLDELPELWNVVRGDMSLVGPRPLLVTYLSLYSPFQARRHEVRPGITGLAQVSGRNVVDWEKKFELDVWYVDNRNTRLDLAILFRTLRVVFSRRGVSGSGTSTTEVFKGN